MTIPTWQQRTRPRALLAALIMAVLLAGCGQSGASSSSPPRPAGAASPAPANATPAPVDPTAVPDAGTDPSAAPARSSQLQQPDAALQALYDAPSLHFVYTTTASGVGDPSMATTSRAEGDYDKGRNAFQYTLSGQSATLDGDWIVIGSDQYHKRPTGWHKAEGLDVDFGTSLGIGILLSSGATFRTTLQGAVEPAVSEELNGQPTERYTFTSAPMGVQAHWQVWVNPTDGSIVRLTYQDDTSTASLESSRLGVPVTIDPPSN
jgi:hypothetical protein